MNGKPTDRERLAQLLQQKARSERRVPASSGQRRLWFLHRLDPRSAAYHIGFYIVLRGALDVTALSASLTTLLRRHGSLRTTFTDVDGEPWQVIAPEAADLSLPVVDLAGIEPPVRRARVEAHVGEELRAPFDLARGPLLRASLLRLAPQEHVLVLVLHHIVGDGWSVNVIARDLQRGYKALTDHEQAPLPALPLQYSDWSARQARWCEGEEAARQADYWRTQLAGLAGMQLDIDGEPDDNRAGSADFTLDPETSRALRRLAEQQGVTLFMVLASAFALLLGRYARRDDVAFGTPIACRTRTDLEGMVGFLANTLVLRTDLSGNPTFLGLLHRVRQAALAAYAHQDLPFEQLVATLQPERTAERNPLFQVAMALQQPPAAAQVGALHFAAPVVIGYDRGEFTPEPSAPRVDLELHLWDDPVQLRGTWCFDRGRYADAGIRRMGEGLQALLAEVVVDPAQTVDGLPSMGRADMDRVLRDWNATARGYRRDSAVHELFEDWVLRAGEAPALSMGERVLSYAELNTRANRLAHHLCAQGVKPGQFVGACLDRGVDLITSLLAIFKAGAVYVPLDPRYPAERLRYMIADAGIGLVISFGGLADPIRREGLSLLRLDERSGAIQGESDANTGRMATATDLAYVIYTSGSTGTPKGVALEHRGLCKVSAEQARLFGAGPGSRVLQFSSPNFDASLFDVVMALTTGGTLVLASAEDLQPGPPLLEVLRRAQVTHLTIPPSSLAALQAVPLPQLAVLNVAGEACPAELVRRWAPGRRFFNLYGPTECTIWSTALECVADGRAPGIGGPIANTRVHVLDAHLRPCPIGVAGELCIGGDGVARGYLNLPELTAAKFIADPFDPQGTGRLYRSGDKVCWRADGTLEFLGRMDSQVKVRGFRVEPGEVEAVLRRQPAVRSAAVVARADRLGEMQLVAYVVVEPRDAGAVPLLREAIRQALPPFMMPASFVMLDAMPLTPNGKVDLQALPVPGRPRTAATGPASSRASIEALIAAIWREVLGLDDDPGPDENFFDLGGHSLRLVKVQERIREQAGCDLPIVDLFRHPTVRTLAARVQDEHATSRADDAAGPAHAGTDRAGHADEPIAVIGMACRFPGAADLERFWQNLRNGVESIRFFTAEELRAAGHVAAEDDPHYVPAKGFLEDAGLFDAQFFGYSPREAELIDPQQRLFLEMAWQALEHAGCDPARPGGAIGVYAGSSENTYWAALARVPDPQADDSFEGTIAGGKDFLATRVAYKLDLHGPAVTVQTACSTSLVAVHEACKSLRLGECDIALAGGVRVSVPLVAGYRYRENSILAPDGHCRAFDAAAQGTLGGDGAGVVVLKRLSAALAAGDRIHAVIRGSGINNDGADKVGYTAPSIRGQAGAIGRALAQAAVPPGTIGYVEAHGTGTQLGDPIEIAALNQVFQGVPSNQIAIGSVKTNFGHLDAAAGVAGFIKTVLALGHGEIPPSLNYSAPNPRIDFAGGPFFVNDRLRRWEPAPDVPRRAGVSSFGIGGTNCHVVLEEAPRIESSGRHGTSPQVLVLSARTPAALDAAAGQLAAFLRRDRPPDLADVAWTLQVGRKRFRHARVLACRSVAEAVVALDQRPPPAGLTTGRENPQAAVVFMFSGQGSQHADMGRRLYESTAGGVFRSEVDRCCSALRPLLGCDLRGLMYPEADAVAVAAGQLTQTRYAQPALFVIEYALARQWMAWGLQPAAMIGHSIGEYVAACLAGVMTLEDALALVVERGRLMYALPAGSMLSVPMGAGDLEPLLGGELAIATINTPDISVVAGPTGAVQALRAKLGTQGIEARLLQTSHAFHSPMMEPILEPFLDRVRQVRLQPPAIPYVSNVSGDWITPAEAQDPGYYARHLRGTVRFSGGLEKLFARPEWVLLEVGPGQVLHALASRHRGRNQHQSVVASLPRAGAPDPDDLCAIEALGRLWLAGLAPDWAAVHAPGRPARVALPAYPFERHRYWLEPGNVGSGTHPPRTAESMGRIGDTRRWTYVPSWRRSPPGPASRDNAGTPWVLFADSRGVATALAPCLGAAGAPVVSVKPGHGFRRLDAGCYEIDPAAAADFARLLDDLGTAGTAPLRIVYLWSIDATAIEDPVQGFIGFLGLLRAWVRDTTARPIEVTVVTSDVADVDGHEVLCPERALMLAPGKVAAMEHAGLRMRAIDVLAADAGRDAALLARRLGQELLAATADPLVAWRGHYRWVQACEPVVLETPAALPARLRREGVYLVTGGFGMVGGAIATYLARTAGARLALLSRTPLPPREEWDVRALAAHAADVTVNRIRAVRSLEALGAEVMVCTGDVTDQAQMRATLGEVERRFGCIHGVVHAASAETELAPLSGLDPADCRRQLDARIAALRALAGAIGDRRPDFCLVNSSLASVLGVMGGLVYTAASLHADAFVEQRNREGGTAWMGVNWDNWFSVGSTTGSAAGQSAPSRGAALEYYLTPDEGAEVLGRILHGDQRQVLVSSGDLARRIERWRQPGHPGSSGQPAAEAAPDPAPPGPAAVGAYPRPALSSEFVAPTTGVERTLAGIWSELLGIGTIGVQDNFFELGGDSVVSIQFVARARQKGLALTSKQIFEHQTIAELAGICARTTAAAPVHADDTGTLPPTPIQRWFFEQGMPGHYFNQSVVLSLREDLDAGVLARALDALVAHHDALRLRYDPGAAVESALRVIAAGSGAAVREVDLSGLDADAQRQRMALVADETQAALDIVSGPILRAVLFRRGAGAGDRLLLVIHHLAVDVISWRILIEDLQALCRAGASARLPAPVTSFRDWARRLAAHAGTAAVEAEIVYWQALRPVAAAVTLPRDFPGAENLAGTVDTVVCELDAAETTGALQALAQSARVQAQDVLLTALAQTLAAWSGAPQAWVQLEGHGRDPFAGDVDVSRTVGWFTALYPVCLGAPVQVPPLDGLHAVRDSLRSVPEGGRNFGLLRYLARPEVRAAMAAVPDADVVFLYLGRQDENSLAGSGGLFSMAPEPGGRVRSPAARRTHLLEITAGLSGEHLRMEWHYSSAIHRRATIEKLAADFRGALRRLVEAGRSAGASTHAPQDFPAARVSQATLDLITAKLNRQDRKKGPDRS